MGAFPNLGRKWPSAINFDELLGYVNEKYKRENKNCYIIFEYYDGINDFSNNENIYIEIGDIIIIKHNKLQFDYALYLLVNLK